MGAIKNNANSISNAQNQERITYVASSAKNINRDISDDIEKRTPQKSKIKP